MPSSYLLLLILSGNILIASFLSWFLGIQEQLVPFLNTKTPFPNSCVQWWYINILALDVIWGLISDPPKECSRSGSTHIEELATEQAVLLVRRNFLTSGSMQPSVTLSFHMTISKLLHKPVTKLLSF